MSQCDACGSARAIVQVILLPEGGQLFFCGHHYEKHRSALQAVYALLIFEDDFTRRPRRASDGWDV